MDETTRARITKSTVKITLLYTGCVRCSGTLEKKLKEHITEEKGALF